MKYPKVFGFVVAAVMAMASPMSSAAETQTQGTDPSNLADAGRAEGQLGDVTDERQTEGAAPAHAEADAELPTIQVESLTDASDEPPTTDAADRPAQLDDVIVTATKREQSARTIPASINAIDGAALEEIGARELKDFLDLVPGINLQEAAADKPRKITIRGVGPSDGANQTTGSLIGDVALTDPYGTFFVVDPDPFDMRTVEVLKGPQGTLFGASALNGVIRYVPNGPELYTWQGKAFVDWTTIEEGGAEPSFGGALNVPIGASIALRGTGVWQNVPGVYDVGAVNRGIVEDADAAEKWSGRVMGLWQATDRLTVNLSHMRQSRSNEEQSFATTQDGYLGRNDAPRPSPTEAVFGLTSLDVRYAFDWATLVSVSAYQTKKSDFDLEATYTLSSIPAEAGISLLGAEEIVDASGFMQELRLVSQDGGPWTWIVGGYFSDYEADIFSNIYVPNTQAIGTLLDLLEPIFPGLGSAVGTGNGISVANQRYSPLDADEQALFGELSRAFGEKWTVSLGGRLYRSHVGGTAIGGGLLTGVTGALSSAEREVEVEGQGFSPRLTATYQASRDVFVYGNVSRGFQFGGINVQGSAIPGVDPEHPTFESSTIWNYEIGTRTDWLDRTLRFDLTAFYLDWTKPQIYQIAPSGVSGYVDNVGASESYGLETSFRYLTPIPGLSLTIAASYVEAKTTKPFVTSDGTEIAAGMEMPLSPKLQTATTLGYNLMLGPYMTRTSLVHSYQGEAWNNIQQDYEVYGFDTYNLNFSISRMDLRLRPALTITATNLTDERGIIGISGGDDADPLMGGLPTTYNRPRTISARLSLDF